MTATIAALFLALYKRHPSEMEIADIAERAAIIEYEAKKLRAEAEKIAVEMHEKSRGQRRMFE